MNQTVTEQAQPDPMDKWVDLRTLRDIEKYRRQLEILNNPILTKTLAEVGITDEIRSHENNKIITTVFDLVKANFFNLFADRDRRLSYNSILKSHGLEIGALEEFESYSLDFSKKLVSEHLEQAIFARQSRLDGLHVVEMHVPAPMLTLYGKSAILNAGKSVLAFTFANAVTEYLNQLSAQAIATMSGKKTDTKAAELERIRNAIAIDTPAPTMQGTVTLELAIVGRGIHHSHNRPQDETDALKPVFAECARALSGKPELTEAVFQTLQSGQELAAVDTPVSKLFDVVLPNDAAQPR